MTDTAPLLLAHDIGTSGTKTSLVAADGRIVASHSTPHATYAGAGGTSEQDANDWWAGVCRNTKALVAQHPDGPRRIAGIGVSGHMLGCLPIDAQGRPLRRCMIHADTRSGAEAARARQSVGALHIYQTTGNVLDARSPLCKMLWLKAHEPDTYRHTWRFLQSKDYVVGCMTGGFDGTDLSDAAHAQWIDVHHKAHAVQMLGALGLDAGKLPALRRGTEVVGRLTASAAEALGLPAGVPVVAGGGDGACASVGAGAVRPGDTYCCLGTTAWIATVCGQPFIDPQSRVFNVPSVDGQHCGVYGTVQSAGRSVQWVLDLLNEPDFSRFDDLIEGAPPGSEDLLFLPYLEGERSPMWDADARGVFFGLTPAHGRAHLVRAVVEGVSFALRSVLQTLRERQPIAGLRLVGGGARSPRWRQVLADVWGAEVQALNVQAADATSLGAAVAAGVGVGLFADLAEGTRRVSITQSQQPDPHRHTQYEKRHILYESLYPRLKEAFAQLRTLSP